METLASFIQNARDNIGLSAKGLARRANIDLSEIEDIEAGKELFLPVTVRQKLAKALRCSPDDLALLERGYSDVVLSEDIILSLKQRILNGENGIPCPKCGKPLVCRIAKMYDLEDNLILEPKAHCSKCVFQLKD